MNTFCAVMECQCHMGIYKAVVVRSHWFYFHSFSINAEGSCTFPNAINIICHMQSMINVGTNISEHY
jgi:hypothetical protein